MTPPTQTPASKTSCITAQSPSSALPTDVAILQQMVLQLLGQINDKTRENFDLQCQLDWLRRQLFGRKSEKMDPKQRLLFAGERPANPSLRCGCSVIPCPPMKYEGGALWHRKH